jgi:hypothetical protein
MSIKEAEATVAKLEAKRAACIAKGTELADERAALSYQAHAEGDAKAKNRLEAVHAAIATHASELQSLDAALRAAADRVEKARQNEAKTEDRQRATALRRELGKFREHGAALDAAAAAIATHGRELQIALTNMRALGSPSPTHAQIDVLGYHALATALMETPWRKRFEHLPPNQRRTFQSLIDAWSLSIKNNIGARESADAA